MVPCATIAGVKSISDVTQESLVSEAVLAVVRHVMWLQQGTRSYRIMHTNNEGWPSAATTAANVEHIIPIKHKNIKIVRNERE